MPVHPHHGAKRLEPEGVTQPGQKGVAPVVVNDRLGDRRPETGHTRRQPRRDTAPVQRKISYTRPPHLIILPPRREASSNVRGAVEVLSVIHAAYLTLKNASF